MKEIKIKKMKNKKYHIVGKKLNSKRKNAERGQIDTHSTQIQYTTAHSPGWYRHFNKKVAVLNYKELYNLEHYA